MPGFSSTLRARPPAMPVRVLLVGEVVVYVGGLMAFLYLALPFGDRSTVLGYTFIPFAVLFPVAMNLLHGRSRAESGIRLDNWRVAAKEAAIAVAALSVAAVLIGLFAESLEPLSAKRIIKKTGLYLAWGPAQQYILCAFLFNRLRHAGLTDLVAAVGAAVLFGLVHSPNWPLVGATGVAGFVSCLLFRRHPNILVLGFAHGLVAIVIYYAWPPEWHEGMTVGGIYLHRMRLGP